MFVIIAMLVAVCVLLCIDSHSHWRERLNLRIEHGEAIGALNRRADILRGRIAELERKGRQ